MVFLCRNPVYKDGTKCYFYKYNRMQRRNSRTVLVPVFFRALSPHVLSDVAIP